MNHKSCSLLACVFLVCMACGAKADLLHRYSFTNGDTTALDSVGGQHGTLENGAAISDNAVQFDGSDDYVNLPGNLITGFSSVTFEAWYTYSASINWMRIFDFGDTNSSTGAGRNYIFYIPYSSASTSRLAISDDDPGYNHEEMIDYSLPNQSVPVHVACVYDGDNETMSLYVDGQPADSISVTIPLSAVDNVYSYLGRSLYPDPYLLGSIDEFRIYDHALDSSEVLIDYSLGPDVANSAYVATNPNPANNSVGVKSSIEPSWTPPTDPPDSYTVYISDDPDLVGAEVISVLSGTSCDPDLDDGTKYYWRVDTNYGATTYTGLVWNFFTCFLSVDSSPAGDLNGDYEVNITDLLILAESWLNDTDYLEFAGLAGSWLDIESALIINEFMADNANSLLDPDDPLGKYDGWIEIYNRSSVAKDLGGMYLTDDLGNPDKWLIPGGVTIEAQGYLIFWADEDQEQGDTHTNFKLDAEGEEIGLFDSDGVTLIDGVIFDEQYRDLSYGRFPDNSLIWKLFDAPTPGHCNCEGYDGAVNQVDVNVDGGFYSSSAEAFDVTLSCSTVGAVIYYTTDFTEPTEASTEYTGPIHIDSTTCLRAAAFKPDWLTKESVSRTYVFLDEVMDQPSWPSGFPTSWGSLTPDYEVDPDVVDDPAYSSTFKDDLQTVPSVCIVIPNEELFGATSGIYSHPTQRGDAWERAASVEIIDPVAGEYCQANAGLRVHGGYARTQNVAKQSLRMIFRSIYGPPKLEFPLFVDSDVESFDQLVLRATWNYSWTGDSGGLTERAQYMREMYGHDTIRDMGRLQGYGRHVNVYLNGLYWGMYILTERPDDGFASEHLGGSKSDYDVIKTDAAYWEGPNVIELLAGDRVAWDQLFALAAEDLSGAQAYANIQEYVDIPALIDYMLMIFHTGSRDAPTLIGTVTTPRNFYAIHKREPGEGFVFLPWDVEWSLEESGTDRVNLAYETGYENPAYLFNRLKANDEFRMLVADHAHKHYFNDGVLTEENTIARYWERSMDMYGVIVGESARWGDARRSTPYTRDIEWVNERNRIINTYFPARDSAVLSQLRNAGLYPNVDAPVFNVNGSYQHGGYISSSDSFSITATSGTVWYTVDDSDPRVPTTTESTDTTLAPEAADKRVLVPDEDIGTGWRTDTSYNDSGWDICTGSPGGVGYENSSGYEGLISFDVHDDMYDEYTSCYIRIPFSVNSQDLAGFNSMTLKARYDDAFVAYINGTEVARRNFTGTPEWDSNADNGNHEASSSNWDEIIDISAYIGNLNAGDNVLAIQGMNYNDTSSDFVICAELIAGTGVSPGGVSPTAIEYTGPITFSKSTHVKARALDGSTWSALNEATYAVGPVASNLCITELMYYPADPNTEFIELKNIGAVTIDPALAKFTNGIDFTFPSLTLDPDEYVLIVENPAEFSAAYPDVPAGVEVLGPYDGSFDNGGERIKLVDAVGQTIHKFDYDDGWYEITDGGGFSLTIKDPTGTDPNLWDEKAGWRPSASIGGSPGEDDSGEIPELGSIKINEVLSHSDVLYTYDWVELYNTTAAPINIGGWYLSDNDNNFKKYTIPVGTTIGGYDYCVLREDLHFGVGNPADPGNVPFALSENGETLYLHSGQDGEITGYSEEEDFGASEADVSFGRYEKSTGTFNFVAMSAMTQGSANAYPKVGPVIINEIMYNPPEGGSYEYVELYNITGSTVYLQEYDNDQGIYAAWKFTDGIEYTFPLGTSIPAHSYLIVAKDTTVFNAYYTSTPGGIQVLGPYDGQLDNGTEAVELSKPGDEVGGIRNYIRKDCVNYSDGSHPVGEDPWPTESDGTGDSLHQKTPNLINNNYGNDVINWEADSPSPGM